MTREGLVRKKISYFLICAVLIAVAGCESLPKKFIRKKQKPEHTPAVVLIEQDAFQKKYSNEYYYKTHYTLWKTWQDETLDNLTGNSKKLARSAEEAYSHLDQMGKYLNPEKSARLKPLAEEMSRYQTIFSNGSYTKSDANAMKADLSRIRRLVANDFYYEQVKADLLSDSVDLGETPVK